MAGLSMSKRGAGLVVAVVLAGLATAALISYVRGVEEKTLRGAEMVGVYVAKDFIPAGTSAEEAFSKGLIAREAVPRRVVASDAITSLEQIRGRVAAVTILKGEQVVGLRFVLPGTVKGALPIPAGRQAISVDVGVPSGVGGFVQPGDRVSIIAQLAGSGGRADAQVQFLLQRVEVLAVGQRVVATTAAPARGQPAQAEPQQRGQVLLTLALTPVEAEKLAFAIFQGELYFTLLPPGQKSVNTPGRTRANAFL